MPVLLALTIVQDESSIRNSSNVSPPANTLQSIGTSLLPVQPEAARNNGTFAKVLSKYTKPLLLVIDEWLLLKLNESESKNLFELIHKRRKKSSTIFCSQFREEGWYDRLGGDDNPLADAIMDRIIYDAYKINIESIDPSKDISMREVYGIDQNIVQ